MELNNKQIRQTRKTKLQERKYYFRKMNGNFMADAILTHTRESSW